MSAPGYDIPSPPSGDTEALEMLAAAKLPAEVLTGFIVVMSKDGRWVASSTLVNGCLPPVDAMAISRQASLSEMLHGLLAVATDAQVLVTADHTATVLAARAQAAVQQQAAAQEGQRVLEQIKFRDKGHHGLHLP